MSQGHPLDDELRRLGEPPLDAEEVALCARAGLADHTDVSTLRSEFSARRSGEAVAGETGELGELARRRVWRVIQRRLDERSARTSRRAVWLAATAMIAAAVLAVFWRPAQLRSDRDSGIRDTTSRLRASAEEALGQLGPVRGRESQRATEMARRYARRLGGRG
ncbi:MAG: hypothetical protein V3V08_25235 [Nannocystaceae bacterium]